MSSILESFAEQVARRREFPPTAELKRLRKAARISVGELAAAVGVSPSAINAYEQGVRRPRGAHLDRYLAALQVLQGAPLETTRPTRNEVEPSPQARLDKDSRSRRASWNRIEVRSSGKPGRPRSCSCSLWKRPRAP